jgi:hypothetical protein
MEELDPSLAHFGRSHGEAVEYFWDTVNFTVAILAQGTIQADAQPKHAFCHGGVRSLPGTFWAMSQGSR